MDDLPPRDLLRLILDKIAELGDLAAQEYFDVSAGTISAWKNGKTVPSLAAAQRVWQDSLAVQSPELFGMTGKETVVLMLPMYNTVEPFFLVSLMKNLKIYGIDKVVAIPKTRTLIDEARNILAQKALLTNVEWFVTADADMILPCGSPGMLAKMGVNVPEWAGREVALTRIMSHPPEYKIVGGLFKARRDGGSRAQCETAFRGPDQNSRLLGFFDGRTKDTPGLEEQGWIAPGFARIHRSVFEDMTQASKPGGLLEDIAPPKGREGEQVGFFGRVSKWRGEDIAFCRRAGMLGIKSYVDTGLLCGHVGTAVY